FRRVFDFHWNSRELFHHVLADQGRMPARTACSDDDVVELEKLFVGHVEAAELRSSFVVEKAAAHAILDRFGLLEDFLEHEMVESTALDLAEIPVNLVNLSVDFFRAKIDYS